MINVNQNNKQETILFCPLNWGLGHASRMASIIYKEKKKNNIIILANGGAFYFLKNEFPDVECIYFKNFSVKHWNKPFINLGLLLQMPLFFINIFIEHFRFKKFITRYNIDRVISDNVYGFFAPKTKNIIITHQLFVKLPKLFKVFEPIIHFIIKNLVGRFDECWIPDYANFDKSLSKELSHGKNLPKNAIYINPLSRFDNFLNKDYFSKNLYADVLILISGPEPARSTFEKRMINRFKYSNEKVLLVCGKPKKEIKNDICNISTINHLSSKELFYLLINCDRIICRSGYSTIMDLHILGLKAEMHPTPGQPEQEYLYRINK